MQLDAVRDESSKQVAALFAAVEAGEEQRLSLEHEKEFFYNEIDSLEHEVERRRAALGEQLAQLAAANEQREAAEAARSKAALVARSVDARSHAVVVNMGSRACGAPQRGERACAANGKGARCGSGRRRAHGGGQNGGGQGARAGGRECAARGERARGARRAARVGRRQRHAARRGGGDGSALGGGRVARADRLAARAARRDAPRAARRRARATRGARAHRGDGARNARRPRRCVRTQRAPCSAHCRPQPTTMPPRRAIR